MKKFMIIINDRVIEYSAEKMNISEGEITLYVGGEVVAFFPRGTSIMVYDE